MSALNPRKAWHMLPCLQVLLPTAPTSVPYTALRTKHFLRISQAAKCSGILYFPVTRTSSGLVFARADSEWKLCCIAFATAFAPGLRGFGRIQNTCAVHWKHVCPSRTVLNLPFFLQGSRGMGGPQACGTLSISLFCAIHLLRRGKTQLLGGLFCN